MAGLTRVRQWAPPPTEGRWTVLDLAVVIHGFPSAVGDWDTSRRRLDETDLRVVLFVSILGITLFNAPAGAQGFDSRVQEGLKIAPVELKKHGVNPDGRPAGLSLAEFTEVLRGPVRLVTIFAR